MLFVFNDIECSTSTENASPAYSTTSCRWWDLRLPCLGIDWNERPLIVQVQVQEGQHWNLQLEAQQQLVLQLEARHWDLPLEAQHWDLQLEAQHWDLQLEAQQHWLRQLQAQQHWLRQLQAQQRWLRQLQAQQRQHHRRQQARLLRRRLRPPQQHQQQQRPRPLPKRHSSVSILRISYRFFSPHEERQSPHCIHNITKCSIYSE